MMLDVMCVGLPLGCFVPLDRYKDLQAVACAWGMAGTGIGAVVDLHEQYICQTTYDFNVVSRVV